MERYKEDNLKEAESEDVDWIQLAQLRILQLALAKIVMHLGVPKKGEQFN
jgi:hypothetical protein